MKFQSTYAEWKFNLSFSSLHRKYYKIIVMRRSYLGKNLGNVLYKWDRQLIRKCYFYGFFYLYLSAF